MQSKELPTQLYLLECFNYNSEAGALYWKQRPIEHFKNEHAWAAWNSKFANTVALNYVDKFGYCRGGLNGSMLFAHRVIWKLIHGTEPNLILHEKGNKTDNRIEKLSSGDKPTNSQDQKLRITNSSGLMGVSWSKRENKWKAYIHVDGKQKHIGSFNILFEACCARKSAEIKYGYHPDHGKR